MLETPCRFAIVAGNDRQISDLREGRQQDCYACYILRSMKIEDIKTSLEGLLLRSGMGASTLLQLFDENGIMVGDAITIDRGRIPQKGEKIARLIHGKPELFVVVDGFHYLRGTCLTEVVNAKRTQQSSISNAQSAPPATP